MNEREKQDYLDKYHQDKEAGVPFFPDIIFKDIVVSFLVFLLLIGLAYYLGAPLEERANPADTSYTPRPEWYFLFLFQLLKYFPGSLEVVGVVVIPTIIIILLFLLPVLDRSPRRHFLDRPLVTGATLLLGVGIIGLTALSVIEAPPPAEVAQGDPVAALYAQNCAACHGESIEVPPGTNLHTLIAQGAHPGMPAWSGDLSVNQIDELAGFILSPGGSQLFNQNCAACHEIDDLVGGNPLDIKNSIDLGLAFPPHADLESVAWSENLTEADRTALLNFLIAPDGQRLFTIYCSSCHGQSVAYSGDETALREIIQQGGQHATMPPWQNTLTNDQIDTLASFVVDPTSAPEGQALFDQYCTTCHGQRVPSSPDVAQARETIAMGGAHQTMPVWGEVLTQDQIDALVSYIIEASEGTSTQVGQALFAENCAFCHGSFGEGGPNPVDTTSLIGPIGTADFLNTHDDVTLFQVISQGMPEQGMSPFGSTNGGSLDDDQIDAIVAYLRSWQANPPVTSQPQLSQQVLDMTAEEINAEICSQCHGLNGEGTPVGTAINNLADDSDQELYDVIFHGVPKSTMLAFGTILSDEQIQQLVAIIRQFPTPGEPTQPAPSALTFEASILPIFQKSCNMCHGTLGGWTGTSYKDAMETGDHAPVVIPGDAENSILAQKMLGTQTFGQIMPPAGKLPDATIQVIIDWINAGAPEK